MQESEDYWLNLKYSHNQCKNKHGWIGNFDDVWTERDRRVKEVKLALRHCTFQIKGTDPHSVFVYYI